MEAIPVVILVMCCVMLSSARVVVFVRPDGQNGCKGTSSHFCITLSQYAANSSDCSDCLRASNMKLVFLMGAHRLERNVSLANLQNVTLEGVAEGDMVTIECTNGNGFLFQNISNLRISGLTISRCSRLHDYGVGAHARVQAGLFFKNVTNLLLSAVSVQKCLGYGLFLSQIHGALHIEDCIIRQNYGLDGATLDGGNTVLAYQQCEDSDGLLTANVQIIGKKFYDTVSGPAIPLHCPEVQISVTLTGVTMLLNDAALRKNGQHMNCSKGGNLAIPTESSASISNINSTVDSMRACVGGGIFIQHSSSPKFSRIVPVMMWNCTQRNNTALNGGTAEPQDSYNIESETSQVLLTGCTLADNELLASSLAMSSKSYPKSVHFCRDGVQVPDTVIQCRAYSGERFNVSVVLVGQNGRTTPGKVKFTPDQNSSISQSKVASTSPKGCSVYSVAVYTQRNSVFLDVRARLGIGNHKLSAKQVHLSIPPPPLGFMLTENYPSYNYTYTCIESLDHHFSCKIKNQQAFIERPPPYWLGFMSVNGIEPSPQFVLYRYCPIDYCKRRSMCIRTDSKTFHQDDQCAYNHAGTLCGQCQPGLSLSLGSSQCLNCTGTPFLKTLGISLGMATIGVLLVFLLLTLNITVTRGTLSGSLFYTNMFYFYWATLLPNLELHKISRLKAFLKFFVFANNLLLSCDRCCLHDGLGVTGRTWVQFILVVYLWALAGAIILLSRRYSWVSRHIGSNAVPTLATIILYSHTSTNLAIIHALRSADLVFSAPGNKTVVHKVLLYDGNIPYFHKTHIPLFIAGCIFAALSLGFTFTLLCVQPLQRYSHLKPFKWVNKLKPLLDAYTCPHIIKPHCRFWNGFLLFVRTILYIILSSHVGHNTHASLDALSIACLIVLTTSLAFGGAYTKRYLNILFSSYIVNLGVLAIVARDLLPRDRYRLPRQNSGIVVASLISLCVATVTSLSVVGYHIYQKVRSLGISGKVMKLCSLCINRRGVLIGRNTVPNYQALSPCIGNGDDVYVTASTSSDLEIPRNLHPPLSVTYREPQLMDYDSA